MLESFEAGGTAVVVGASGGIGQALMRAIDASGRFGSVVGLARGGVPPVDLTSEASVRDALASLRPSLVIIASGLLHRRGVEPEKTLRALDPAAMAEVFAVNTIGPALVMKHVLPRLPKDRKCVFAVLSAKVGSIEDNRLGGWYSYRASKAAVNQLVRTAAIEMARTHPKAVCLALHPGTVATGLSGKFAKSGLTVQAPDQAAQALLTCIDRATPAQTGLFLDRTGQVLPW
ncbi:SDR family NAD(P)-dependent oxidoreductase [Falsirhodobacter halotolerans]|uniref:SDR family NAD(P)-dependent oxidoreductase n=1 Tax=Falsirhodobacter halotolerans TaxID=1146892 RepID=UPI001FCFD6C0|nr:SDR family NAD(P)-dependent oxidoreductase [Falsirhodobacter halotolerans]MCJ8141205.1 SDR family NAD(P)-dependent oxidoreductase [Falsirhodobacter halotolerans]